MSAFAGGFLGVDIFFVISGYLITAIITKEIESGSFKLISFYERRARRILPALFLVILLSIISAYFIFVPYQIKDLSQSIISSVAFVSNYFFYLETDYFNEFTNRSPLLHTWTLSVEEQFYLFYPIILIAIYKLIPKALTAIIFLLIVLSFACALYLTHANPTLSFYATQSRAWELMVGALICIQQDRLREWFGLNSLTIFKKKLIDLLSLSSLLIIIVCVLTFTKDTNTPSWTTAIPVLSAGVILFIGSDSTLAQYILSSRPMVSVGKLSYSLYIFHQPVNSFLYYSSFGEVHADSALFPLISILITAALSVLSFSLVERPIRYSVSVSRHGVFAGAGIVAVLLVVIGYQGHRSDGLRSHMVSRYSKAGNVLLVDVDSEKKHVGELAKRMYWQYNANFDVQSSERILVIGDSMANDAFLSLVGLREKLSNPPFSVRALRVDDECMDIFKSELQRGLNGDSQCLKDPDLPATKLLDARNLINSAKIILITAIWQQRTYEDGYNLANYLGNEVDAKIFVIGTMLFNDTTSISLKFARMGIAPKDSESLMYENLRYDRLRISDKLRSLVNQDPKLHWIEKRDHLCDMSRRRCTVFYDDGAAIVRDGAHFTVRAYDSFAEFLLRKSGVVFELDTIGPEAQTF